MQIDRILGNVGVLYVGAYNSSTQYEYLNCVTYNGSSYVCINQNGVIGVTPGTTSDWQLSAKQGDVGPVGPKPINGVDYNTDEEKEEFKNDVVSKATEEVEKNVAEIETEAIENYNKNATQKITEYNTNANTQVESFNTNATSKTNDFNSNASTKTEEFNAVVDEEKEQFAGQTEAINHHIAVVSDELERVKNDVLETGEESGSYITLNDSAMAEYQELSVDGVCEQETTSGKNLLNVPNEEKTVSLNASYSSLILYNVNVKLEPNNYVLSYKIKSSTNSLFNKFILMKEDDTNIVVSSPYKKIGNTYEEISVPFTINEETTIKRIFVQTVDDGLYTFKEIMVSTNGGVYEPYTGGQPSPNPDYPQPISVIENSLKITSCNKNLLKLIDGDFSSDGINANVKNGIITLNGTLTSGISFLKLCDFNFTFKANTIYSVSTNPSYFIEGIETRFRFATKNGDIVIKDIFFSNSSNKSTFSFKEDTNVEWLQIITGPNINYNNLVIKPQLEEGPTATPFEQHIESVIEANLPEGEFIGKLDDTYKDTLKVEYNEDDGHYHLNLYKNIRKVVLDGSETIFLLATFKNVCRFSVENVVNSKTGSKCKSNMFVWYSNQAINETFNNVDEEAIHIRADNKGLGIKINKTIVSSVGAFKSWLSTHNTEVYYALATPYVVDLGVVDQLISYDKVSNVFTNSDLLPQINLKYYRNFISTVRNLQVNEKSLKQELIDINNRLSALESATTNVVSESEVVE